MGAIDGSVERCLLLTGDPGAGKSVALRHLATQIAMRAKKSRKMYEPIPLYINLRELGTLIDMTPQGVKKFVIDNVRRGDADTADYLKNHWDEFNAKGGWIFLFDSFDEIPDVLHSASESEAVNKYGKVIQQFMDGMGDCRGVLASRDFKSPNNLIWPRLRILPLNEGLQERLVRHTFLTQEQKTVALQAISKSTSSTYKNPLFLNLLCRYVKQNLVAPRSEHELLIGHIDSLAARDQSYVEEKWKFNKDELLTVAGELARAFATSSELGLAPTVAEIERECGRLGILGNGVHRAVEALTYVKIGRTDVASPASSERRFAFAHRRYHEAIFAEYLSENYAKIGEKELISNPKWREYLVAMLQSSDARNYQTIIDCAVSLIDGIGGGMRLANDRVSGFVMRTYSWDDPILEHVLKIFVDVKRFNPSAAWAPVERSVERIFGPLWSRGDYFDRLKVIEYGGAGDPRILSARLDEAMHSRISIIQETALSSCQFASSPTEKFADWVRKRVAMKIVKAKRRFDVIKWEAIGAELPAAYCMSVCLVRAKSLSRSDFVERIMDYPFDTIERALRRKTKRDEKIVVPGVTFPSVFLAVIALYLMWVALGKTGDIGVLAAIFYALGSLVGIWILINGIRASNISYPKVLGVGYLVGNAKKSLLSGVVSLFGSILVFLVLSIPAGIVYAVGRYLGYFEGVELKSFAFNGFLVTVGIIFAIALSFGYLVTRSDKRSAKELVGSSKSLRGAVSKADDADVVLEVCRISLGDREPDRGEIRRAISFLSERSLNRGGGRSGLDRDGVRSALSLLIERMLLRS